jgi:phosphatidate phosphatase LPIN
MQFVGKFITTVSEFYKDINPATLSGAIDVVVIEQPDGTLACSPFHVRFGKLQILRLQGSRVVDIAVNGVELPFKMRMGEAGEAYFVRETPDIVTGDLAATLSGPSSPDLYTLPTHTTSDKELIPAESQPVEGKTPGEYQDIGSFDKKYFNN